MNDVIDCSDRKSLSLILKELLPEAETLCEPFFGGKSLILSPLDFHFKVKILNDSKRGLVNLFELSRVDTGLLEYLLKKHDSRDEMNYGGIKPDFFTFSPFLTNNKDIKVALDAFRFLRELLHDIADLGCKESLKYIHDLLKPVLVENLPHFEFLERFDRHYTVFFVPGSYIDDMEPILLEKFLQEMKGMLLTGPLEKTHAILEKSRRKFGINIQFEPSPVGKKIFCFIPR